MKTDDAIVREISRVLKLESDAIVSARARLGGPEAARAVRILEASLACDRKIVVTGVGKSGRVAEKIAATFSSTGSLAVFLHPTEALHGDMGLVRPGDSVLALSQSGSSEEIVGLVPSLRARGASLIAMTAHKDSRLGQACDAWLDTTVEQEACALNLAPTASSTLMMAIGDALAVTLMKLRGFTAEGFAANHPGGALGRRLNLKVRDLMSSGERVAALSSEASVDEVVLAATEKKLGIVLVVDGERLLGVVTDGDIRRALQHRERFFSLKARDIMNREPVTVGPDALASQALELMERRPGGQIAALPVVEAGAKAGTRWLGVIRLHDVVGAF